MPNQAFLWNSVCPSTVAKTPSGLQPQILKNAWNKMMKAQTIHILLQWFQHVGKRCLVWRPQAFGRGGSKGWGLKLRMDLWCVWEDLDSFTLANSVIRNRYSHSQPGSWWTAYLWISSVSHLSAATHNTAQPAPPQQHLPARGQTSWPVLC